MPRKKCSCGKRPIYNIVGNKPMFCAKCKMPEMINVRDKRCPCGKIPSFNVSREKKPICCAKCKTDDMVDVTHKKCLCGKKPSYNVPGETKGVACSKCKTDEMIDVRSKKCPCGKQPVFNVPGETTGVCCVKCKTSEMINVVAKRCPCGRQPSFNVVGEKIGVCCAKCKTSEMIDVMTKRCPCGNFPIYNVSGDKPVCCSKCKTDDMVCIVARICPGYDKPCPVRTQLSYGHDYCMSCDPNDARRKRYKLHEEAFFDYVKEKLDIHKREFIVKFNPEYTSNKFARLDGIVFGDGIIVCLEVDENGHEEYVCDEHRMHLVTAELLQKYPEYSVSWVRVNPTVDVDDDWCKRSKVIRKKRFDDVIDAVNDILNSRDTRIVYIGFD